MRQQKIEKVLESTKQEIKVLLKEMYPNDGMIIDYHFKESFVEWFAFLFDSPKWILQGPKEIPIHNILISQTKFNEVQEQMEANNILFQEFDAEMLNHLTVVKPDDKYRVVDGWHRLYRCCNQDLVNVPVYEWVKLNPLQGNHPKIEYALKIRQLIIDGIS